jgi:hypothetical protein
MGEFSAADRELLDATDEVEIETRSGKKLPIWIVVDGEHVYVRSVRGFEGRWYQALLGGTEARLHLGSTAWTIRGEQVTDTTQIERVSDALRRKYHERWAMPTEAMLRQEVLPATLRIFPT